MANDYYSIRGFKEIGKVDAEEDAALLNYFVKTDAVNQLIESKTCLVLGRKGSGKTALVRYFSENEELEIGLSRPLGLKGYPWAIHQSRKDAGTTEVDSYVASWRYLIAVQLATLVLEQLSGFRSPELQALNQFLRDNYGGPSPELKSILTPARLRLTKASIEPMVLGNKLGAINLERDVAGLRFGIELDALTDAILRAVKSVSDEFGMPPVLLHFDELDQGMSELDKERSAMLIGLVLASRSVRSYFQKAQSVVSPIVYLRSDIWQALNFSDKNKITQSLALTLDWDLKSLSDLVDERLKSKLNGNASFSKIEDGQAMRGSQLKLNHIIARSFNRPRDVISFINCALAASQARDDTPLLLSNKDVVDARTQYSNYLKRELDDEISAVWPDWGRALRALTGVETVTFTFDEFSKQYVKERGKDSHDADSALDTLYQFSVIGYETRSGYGGSGWCFRYTSPDSVWDGSATRYKVHPGLKEYAKLREERGN